MEPSTTDDLDERLESLPWEHVKPVDPPDRRWIVVVAGAVVVAAVAASAARTLWPAPPLTAPLPASSLPVPEVVSTPEASPSTVVAPPASASPMTEADLRAISPDDAARAVAAHAEWFVSEWLTIDGRPSDTALALLPDGVDVPVVDASARSFVESTVALSVEETEPGTWEAAVLVRSLSAFGDGDYLRIPARVFFVAVGMGDDGPYVVDLPSPGPLSVGRAAEIDLVEESAPVQVTEAAVMTMREAGLPDETTMATFRLGDLWRVTGVVRDEAGVPFVVAVWLDGSGERVVPPG